MLPLSCNDREGNLLDTMLSEACDLETAKQIFARALAVVGTPPQRITTDGHAAYPRAIRETLGWKVLHRRSPYLNSRLEQDHRESSSAIIRCRDSGG